MEPYLPVQESYAAFALEAADSPTFADWARRVADDAEVQALIAELPRLKQQPNLVFASARWHGAQAPGPYDGLRHVVTTQWPQVRATILERSTQTNEAGRLATLLPAFAAIADGRPLALIEVGASAGLCLYPDRYTYRWRRADGEGVHVIGHGPELTCEVSGPAPLPEAAPHVAWRAGIDLNPLDVTDADQMAWLQNLVWPEQDDRRAQLARAIEVARAEPPYLVAGDLVATLPALLAEAPSGAVPVVFHSAVIAYLEPDARQQFHDLMTGLVADGRCHWVSNEGPNVLPAVTATGPEPDRIGFVLGIDGRAVAQTHGHGRTLHWR